MSTFFARLRTAAGADWQAYVGHAFVDGLARGTLPEAAFRHYLVQDYLFLIHFARAYALAVVKADDLAGMRSAAATLDALINHEMKLHIEFCRDWGITPEEMEQAPEAAECMAYTRYVLDRGLSGDILDLKVALAPCVVGYREIAAAIRDRHDFKTIGNPYLPWIEMYSGADYGAVADDAVAELDRLAATRATEARFPALARTFAEACRLEAGFWEMGWRAGQDGRKAGLWGRLTGRGR
ncbi:thiaminase II [Zavarzinia compransoris]|uniref:thiaminase II n=1 Tax=Zavarzinia compransoris TaxID=1264899 RepID=UPI0010E9F19A|nr:thiaminase II [Zavarzinia compransoris]TDP47988.1 thiaminase/transcriptional activator TenA [Zavarzinia compransoris]